jgi:hypothetical protein
MAASPCAARALAADPRVVSAYVGALGGDGWGGTPG